MPMSRRGALAAGGALGLLGLGAGTASAQGSGQIGTSDMPIETLYTQKLNGGLTSGSEIRDLVGVGLEIYETDGRLDVDWSAADELDGDGRVSRPELWMSSGEPPLSLEPNDISNVTIPNMNNVNTITTTNDGDGTLEINFGGDTLELNNVTSPDTDLTASEEYIEISIDTSTYYVRLYEES